MTSLFPGVGTCTCQMPCDPPQPDECNAGPDFDECASSPCQNGGLCTAIGDTYTCDCLNDWLGENCDIPPPCDDPTRDRTMQHCSQFGHCQVRTNDIRFCFCTVLIGPDSHSSNHHQAVPDPTDPTAQASAFNDVSADCLSCKDGCAGKPGNWCWYYHTNFPEVCDAAAPVVCSTPDCLSGRWQDVYLQIADPSQPIDCTGLPAAPRKLSLRSSLSLRRPTTSVACGDESILTAHCLCLQRRHPLPAFRVA